MRLRPPAALALMATVALAAAAWPQPATQTYGPLRTANAYPPVLPFLALAPEAASALPVGRLEVSTALVYGNVFHWDPTVLYSDLYVLIDMEVARLGLDFDYGLGAGLTLGVGFALVAEYGGFADPAIQAFHTFLNLPNGDREKYGNDGYSLIVVKDGETMVDLTEPGISLGDTVLRLKWSFLESAGEGLTMAAQVAVKLPTGSTGRFTGSGAFDGAAGLLLTVRLGASAIHGGLRYLRYGEPKWPAVLGFDPQALGFFLGLEHALSRRLAVNLQVDGATTPYTRPHRWFSPVSGGFEAGLHVRVGPASILQVYLAEELPGDAALDVAAGVGLSTRF